MKYKRRRVLEVPPRIRSFISSVTDAPLESIEEPLRGFVWNFDKGDFHHWVDLFNHFDSFFEKYIKPRKDLQVEDNFLEVDLPFPRESVLQILRVTRIILENCSNKHFYSSYEQHLSSLLASIDADVVEASLHTLAAFLKKPVGKCSIRDASLTSKLLAFSQGWGSKEEGLGLVASSLNNQCDSVASGIGSSLHFEFYAVGDSSKDPSVAQHVNPGLRVIHLPNIHLSNDNSLLLLHHLVKEYHVPPRLRFSLLTRLRFARAFGTLSDRHQYICIRLYAFIALVQASTDTDDLASFFNNEPEFINELVSLLSYEDEVPEKIRILAIMSLVALCQDRSRQPTVLSSVTSGGYRGILPSLMQKAVDSITSGSLKMSVVFAEALLSLVSVLVSSTPGSLALQEAGYIPTILPLLKDTNPQHLQLVSTAVHVVEGFLDFNNPTAALFRDLGGLDETIARLMVEVSCVEKCSKKNVEEAPLNNKGKQVIGSSSELQPPYSEVVVSYHRRLLMKALLRAISLATYVPGTSARIDGSEESVLPRCLCIIFRRAKDFGGGVFSLAAVVLSDLLHKDPTCFPVLDAADLPRAFLDAILSGVLCSAEAVTCIPQCLDALCLNNTGLQLVKERNALRCFVKIFTSRSYLKALTGDTPGTLSSALDELMRHASSLRPSGVDMLLEILNVIAKIGSGSESNPATDSLSSPLAVAMQTDVDERKSISSGEGETSKMVNSEQMIDSTSDGTSVGIESFLPECISNTAHLLETVLQNADTCRLFIEKKGLEAVLKLFTLQLLPISVPVGQSISFAFKSFSPQHSAALARAVCSFIREHLKLTNELLGSVCGAKLAEIGYEMQMEVLKCLYGLEGILSFTSFLLKGTTTMLSELGSADADILNELGKAYKEIVWQISLSSDSKVDEKQDTDNQAGSGDASMSSPAGRESDDDGNVVPLVRYMNPLSVRNSSASPWNVERDFVSVVRSAGSMHRHGRHGLSRIRGGRMSRHLDVSLTDSEVSVNTLDSLMLDIKKKSPAALVSEVLTALGSTIRSFHATLMKGLAARRRADSSSLSPASKALVTALAKLFHDALSYSGHSTVGLEMLLSVKCRYLGKVVDDMAALIFDNRRRVCNTALVNSFYVNGTFKELLTTYEATSQLLWTLPFSTPTLGNDQGSIGDGNKVSHSSWLLDTLQSYCRLLEYHVNSSVLVSPTSSSQSQLLVQPVAAGLSIGLFPVPRDPDVFIRMLQSQVLDVILPVWNHPLFPKCSPALVTAVVSLVTHIYSGVGDVKRGQSGITGSTGPRLSGPALDESTVATIVEMGFSRARAEEALRNVGTNSVEMATDWLFSHPEEFVQEDVQLAQALALSLGNSSETSKDDSTDEARNVFTEDRGAETPPVDDILAASMKLIHNNDLIAFPLTELLATLCNRNKGEDRQRVVLYLIQQLKLCPSDFSKDTGSLFPISHILALLVSEDSSTREIGAENGVVSAVLDILMNFRVGNESRNEASVTKSVSALLLILNSMLQSKPRVPNEMPEGSSKSLSDSSGVDITLAIPSSTTDVAPMIGGVEKESGNAFERILGKSTGYLNLEESQRAMAIACDIIKQQVPAAVMQADLQLCARLTKTHAIATQFLEAGGLAALFSLPRSCMFPGFDSLASVIIRHLLEDPQTLQTAMELEIRQTLTGTHNRHAGRLSPRLFLTSMAPVISRDPEIFMRAASAVCQLESAGGRMNIVLLKEKEKDKDKQKASGTESGAPSNEPIRLPENKPSDTPGKCSKGHRKVPASLTQAIDQLLEIILSYPSSKGPDECTSFLAPMEVDEPVTKEKGKSKVDESHSDLNNLSERSEWLAKVTFVLKLMSDILLMYVHAVGVVLRRDSETCPLRGTGQSGGPGHGGIVHHVLHELLPLSSYKTAETSDELRDKLSEKASWFLVVLCGRSTEGRRRVISEIVKAFSCFSDLESNSSKSVLLPEKKILAFADLVNSILSKNSSGNVPGPGLSPDIAKTMIDGGMVQSLSSVLRVIDLDHPDALKVVNLILKALENLTRAANARDQMLKLDGLSKKRSTGVHERTEEPSNARAEAVDHEPDANSLHEATDLVQTEAVQVHESPQAGRECEANPNQSVEQDMQVDREENATNAAMEDGVELMRQEMDDGVLPNANEIGLDFQVEHRMDDEMGEEDEDMGEDGDDDDEDDEDDDEEDEDIAEDGAALISLADTDGEDHDENGMGDEYNDDMIDEEDDGFPENRVIEVRWREGLTGLDHLRVLRGSGDPSSFIDIAAEPFRGVNADDIFHVHSHRPLSGERRHQSGSRSNLDRSGLDGNAFQHPLLLRPLPSGEPPSSMWSSVGNSSRELEGLSFGSFDVAHFYMFDAGLPSEHAATTVIGDRFAAPPPLIDFSLGMDSLHMGGRRGSGDSRWTDDGQPQAGGQAAAIAQAVEEQFMSQLSGAISVDNPVGQRQSEHSAGQPNQQSPVLNPNNQSPVRADNLSSDPDEGQHHETGASSVHQPEDLPAKDVESLPDLPRGTVDVQSVAANEDQRETEIRQRISDNLNATDNGRETMHVEEDLDPASISSDTPPEGDASTVDVHIVDHHMQDASAVPVPHDTQFHIEDHQLESRSSSHALIEIGSTMPDSSDGRADSAHTSADFDMNCTDSGGNQVENTIPASGNVEELPTRENTAVPQEGSQVDQVNNESSSTNAIDPTFLEALPEDLRAEVLASQQAQSAQTSTYAPPPAEEIDPEFLAALPPDIQAEVLAQQRAQRNAHAQQAEGQPVDMDNASIIATFSPDLREEVLLTSSEAVLSALPSTLLAEAQMLRDRAVSHYHARSSIFGGSHRLGGSRRLAVDRHTVMDRGVGVTIGQRAVSNTLVNSLKVKEIEGMPLLDATALKALIRLLRLAQPLGKGLLQRLLLNLCAHSLTRTSLVGFLVDMIRPEAYGSNASAIMTSQRLYGCQWNVVYGRVQPSDGLPPLVSRRVLEMLTYLATNHSSVASVLFYFDTSSASKSLNDTHIETKEKGKEKIFEGNDSFVPESSPESDVPLILFLKLLNRPLFLRSSAHLEQVMGLLQVVVNNAVIKIDCQPQPGQAPSSSEPQAADGAPSDSQKGSSIPEQKSNEEKSPTSSSEVPSLGGEKVVNLYDIFLQLPHPDLRNLCSILAREGLSDKAYSLASEVMKKLAFVASPHRKFFAFELAGLAHNLSVSAVGELMALRSSQMLGLGAGSMVGAAILRVLQALSMLTLVDANKGDDAGEVQEERSILLNLNGALEPLWLELSDCITTTETKLEQSSSFSSPVAMPDSGDLVSGSSSLSPPLPPGTQRLLPFIEAFFVLCEKLQTNQPIVPTDNNVTAREVKEFGTSSSPSLKCGGTGSLTFTRIAEKHRRLLNVFIRQNPSLLEKSLSMMLKVPRLIDFDNKRAYFRSRIRQQHDQHPSAPLRISVRRAYVLEDSYSQLRLRPTQDLKGRLTVQFQGEEGIDAGGLTREWYQLLSRVIFDKGALLFTTVGNNATFQPNPNSVYQTEHLSYFKFVGRVVAKALFDGQLLDVYFTRSFYKHILGVKVTYHDIEAVDPDYYKNLKWMLENDVSDIPDLTFSMDADEEKHILYEKTEVTDYELIPGGRNIRVTEERKHEYVDLVAEHLLTNAIRPQINSFLEGFNELVPRDLISIFNDKELELLISGLPEIDLDDLKVNTEYTGYTAASTVIHWFWEVVKAFNKEDMARFLQFVTGTSKVPLDGFKALQGISGPQRFQIHKAYGAPERLPSAHTCFNQLDLPEYSAKEQLEERLLLAIHEASEGFGFG